MSRMTRLEKIERVVRLRTEEEATENARRVAALLAMHEQVTQIQQRDPQSWNAGERDLLWRWEKILEILERAQQRRDARLCR